MKIIPVIFTFAPDGPCVLEAFGALLDTGFREVYIAEDASHPLLPETREVMISGGAVFIPSYHQGHGERGLRSRPVLANMSDAYLKVLGETGADYLYKVDSDTVVHRTGRVLQAAADGVAAAGWSWAGCEFGGCCALFSRETLKRIHEVAYSRGPLPRGLSDIDCPEDIASIVIARIVGDVRIWPYVEAGGYAASWQYREHPIAGMDEYARRFDVVTFGNRNLLQGTSCERRAQVALAMAEYRKLLIDIPKDEQHSL